LDAEIDVLFPAQNLREALARRDYTTSLDAALALAERVPVAPYTGPITLTIAGSGQAGIDHSDPCRMGVQAFGNTPALALCIAILKANHKDKP
jgi:hypothetical protein